MTTSSKPIITHCEHGLDLRIHPRCYLCKPLTGAETPYPTIVIRDWPAPTGTGSTTGMNWCGICSGYHIPGAGPCTATYTRVAPVDRTTDGDPLGGQ
jgi:hypothetical protein